MRDLEKRWTYQLRTLPMMDLLVQIQYVLDEDESIAAGAPPRLDAPYTHAELAELADVLERTQRRIEQLLPKARVTRDRVRRGEHWSQKKLEPWP